MVRARFWVCLFLVYVCGPVRRCGGRGFSGWGDPLLQPSHSVLQLAVQSLVLG